MDRARIIFIHGPPASGKLTVGAELSRITGLPLFHNHLVVDLLLTLFPFGSPEFVDQRERIWLSMMGDAVARGTSLIFTFSPERTVRPDFPSALAARAAAAGGSVSFVELLCSQREIERRIGSASRREFNKLASPGQYRALKREGAFRYRRIKSEIRIDSTKAQPAESAARIAAMLGIGHGHKK
jgi:chloramphenicol 3-O-phosphotransferase